MSSVNHSPILGWAHDGNPIYGPYAFTNKENTLGVIYIIRDPRDVVLSMSNHYKITFDESIDKLLDENFCLQWQDTDNLYENKKKPLLPF